MSRFQIGSPSSSTSHPSSPHNASSDEEYDNEDYDTLPHPQPLSRTSFLPTNFSAQSYLSNLPKRHQSLEDLRAELRARSQLLNRELLDLVNGHYQDFLSLGSDLNGGEEKVEAVRVGLLGFEREVEAVRRVLGERMAEVGGLVERRKRVREEVRLGRGLVEVECGLGELEEALGMKAMDHGVEDQDEAEDEDEDEDSDDEEMRPLAQLRSRTVQYTLLTRLIQRLGPQHPFLQAQQPRVDACRTALLLDLRAATKNAREAGNGDAVFALLTLFAELGEGAGHTPTTHSQ